MPFEQVTYWNELRHIFDWTQTHVHGCFNICWGAQAAVYHFHGMPKHQLVEKAFGVYRHRNLAPASPYLRGFSDDFSIPVSRWTEVRREDIPAPAGRSICSIILSMIPIRSATSISGTSLPGSP
jgi:homoserine O-succinyltransferase